MKQSFKQIGFELEFTDINRRVFSENILLRKGFSCVHDASIESTCPTIGNIPVGKINSKGIPSDSFSERNIIGGEFISPIIDISTNEWVKDLIYLISSLKFMGERPKTKRGSIHIHVNFPAYLLPADLTYKALINSWILAGYLEASFFRLGSMGYSHRGENMEFIYYRPITNNGPQIILDHAGNYRPLLEYNHVLRSKNISEFSIRCGYLNYTETRYHPSRYMWINYYPIFRNTSSPNLEFRLFNKSLNWKYIYAIAHLCTHFVSASFDYETADLIDITGINPEIYNNKVSSLLNPPDDSVFDSLISVLKIEDTFLRTILREIWDNSIYPFYVENRVFSHLLRDNRIIPYFYRCRDEDIPDIPVDFKIENVVSPSFLNVHLLRELNINIYPEEM